MWFSASEIAGLPGLPNQRRNVVLKALRENWESRPRQGKGGGREYHISSLPPETQAALRSEAAPELAPLPDFVGDSAGITHYDREAERAATAKADPLPNPAPTATVPEGMSPIALVQADWLNYLASSGQTKQRALTLYPDLYNSGQRPVSGLLTWANGKPRQITVGWLRERDHKGFGLGKAPGQGRFNKIESSPALKALIWTWLKGNLKPNIRLLWDLVCERYAPPQRPSRSDLYAYCAHLERTEKRILLEHRHPDAARGRYGAAAGTQHTETQPNQCWEWDGTPADVWLPNHGRYSLLNCVDKFTRRLAILVWPSVSSQGYGILTWKLLRDWGRPQRIVSDQGSAEKAALLRGLLMAVGVPDYTHVQAYSPEKKGTIERHNRTINDWLKVHPNWKGSNVSEAQALRSQISFAARQDGEHLAVMDCTPDELQAWLEERLRVYHHSPHSGLGGKTPDMVYREALGQGWRPEMVDNLDALRVLLIPAGTRIVTKARIRYEGGEYLHERLGDVEINGREVECRLDPTDAGKLYVFLAGVYICTAQDASLLGENRLLIATATKEVEKRTKRQRKAESKAAEKLAGGTARELVQEVLAAQVARADQIMSFPVEPIQVTAVGVQEAAKALADAAEGNRGWRSKPIPLTPEEAALQAELIRQDEEARRARPLEKAFDRAWRIANATPDQIDDDDRQWWRQYLKTEDGQWFVENHDRPLAI